MRNLIVLIGIYFLFLSCKKTPVTTVVLPSNLRSTIAVNAGLVEVISIADKANFYTHIFFRGNDSTIIETTSGIADYTYTLSGTYAIKTKAHTTYSDYIERIDSVSVNLDTINSRGYTTPLSYPNYTLVWNDEFAGNNLSSDWTYDIGTGNWGWGNNELQYYRSENATVGDGFLTITAKQENFGGQNYTSSRIKTQGLKSFKRGRIDIRAKLPFGKGMWPALWMLGDNISSVSWPACGEIDIMEITGGGVAGDKTVYGTIHWQDNNGNRAQFGGNNVLNSGRFSDEFHVFSIIWDANSIRWLRDDIQYHVADLTPSDMTEFNQNFFFIFNVAVGGNWPGSPDATTVFPQTMLVDYVRVFQ
jgi:beta-glucanase (GH16 family)